MNRIAKVGQNHDKELNKGDNRGLRRFNLLLQKLVDLACPASLAKQ